MVVGSLREMIYFVVEDATVARQFVTLATNRPGQSDGIIAGCPIGLCSSKMEAIPTARFVDSLSIGRGARRASMACRFVEPVSAQLARLFLNV